MLDHLLKVGTAIVIKFPPFPARTAGVVWEKYALSQFSTSITERTILKFKTKTSASLDWLPWMPLRITVAPQGSLPLGTGPMSGCLLVTYTQNQQTLLAHIGTEANMDDENEAIRKAFDPTLRDPSVKFVAGFNPSAAWAPVPKVKIGMRGYCLAVLETGGSMRTIYLEIDPNTVKSAAGVSATVLGNKQCVALSLDGFKTELLRKVKPS